MKQTIDDILRQEKELAREDMSPTRAVSAGHVTGREAVKQHALRRPLRAGSQYLRPGDELDPVLAHHLRRSHL
jgi:hypothetical protein